MVGPPKKCLGNDLNTRTSWRDAVREGVLLVVHCGFTIHEPDLQSSGTKAALYNIVILKLCTCLSFPYQQQLEKMAKRDWGGGKEDGGESQHRNRQPTASLMSEAPDPVTWNWCQSVMTAFFLPDTEEVRMDIKKAYENEADEAKDLLPWYLKVLGYIYPAPH